MNMGPSTEDIDREEEQWRWRDFVTLSGQGNESAKAKTITKFLTHTALG